MQEDLPINQGWTKFKKLKSGDILTEVPDRISSKFVAKVHGLELEQQIEQFRADEVGDPMFDDPDVLLKGL